MCLSAMSGRSRTYLIASVAVSLVQPRIVLVPSFFKKAIHMYDNEIKLKTITQKINKSEYPNQEGKNLLPGKKSGSKIETHPDRVQLTELHGRCP